MAVDDGPVKVCQQEIVKLDLQINAIIQVKMLAVLLYPAEEVVEDITVLDIRSCDGPIESLHSLNRDAREKIQDTKTKIEELERLAREQEKETDQVVLLKHVENHRKQLSSTQMVFRQANLTCQMAIEKEEKSSLLQGPTEARQRVRSSKENLAKTTANLTESLMSISRTMDAQVKHSEKTKHTLMASSRQVTSVHDEFENMSGHIQHSRKLLSKYGRRECTDKLLILLALVFFFATVLYILKKRLLTGDPA